MLVTSIDCFAFVGQPVRDDKILGSGIAFGIRKGDAQLRNQLNAAIAKVQADGTVKSLAQKYLSYFQGNVAEWAAPDARLPRQVVPENRLRAYDVRRAMASIVDVDSVLELRADYGVGVVTALVRVEGVPYGLVANSSHTTVAGAPSQPM